MNLLDLWPVAALTVCTLGAGICAGYAADAWCRLRDLRTRRTVDR